MKFYLCVIAAGVIFTCNTADAAVALRLVDLHPDHPGKCYDPTTEKAYEVGESWSINGHCLQNHCDLAYNKLSIHISGCGLVVAPEFCRTTAEDITKAYPDCCPHIVCS